MTRVGWATGTIENLVFYHKQYLFAFLFSVNEKKTLTDQLILQIHLFCFEKRIKNLRK